MSRARLDGCLNHMRFALPFLLLLAACGASPGADAGADAGVDGGADAGASWCLDARAACEWPGRWSVSASLARDYDAGGFSPCLPLPPLDWTLALDADGGAWCSASQVTWAAGAGCALRFEASFSSSNPSETYRHAIALTLDAADGGLSGAGTYTLTGGSNCVVPLDATGARLP